ncbi:nuclear transport factor 2 family protein [Sphingomonas sp.]|jgi:hypothetical protein|uniref:nuclear transport factor 2 family protein n=1 Tax=Sphingomonas sp. TaxID=28214 RepID=UPI0035C87C71
MRDESDEGACARLVVALMCSIDRRRVADIPALFAEDGYFRTRTGEDIRGREALAAMFAGFDPAKRIRHVLSPSHVWLTGEDSAEGLTDYMVYEGAPGAEAGAGPMASPGPTALNEIHSRFVRVEGRWHIAAHQVSPVFRFAR